MRYFWGLVAAIIVLGMFVCSAAAQSLEDKATGPNLTFTLPKPHAWNMKSILRCNGLARVSLHQNLMERDKLVAQASAGSFYKLELTLVGDVLVVRMKESTKPDRYKVVGNTRGFLSAVFIGSPVPVVNSIVIDKEDGFAVWSISEPIDLATDVPYHEATYMVCQ